MKRFLKLNRDIRPQEQPPETYQFAKNGIQNWLKGSAINEPGFALSSASIPYRVIGVLETDKFPVIFSTDNTYSAFGYYDTVNDTYIPIFNDNAQEFKVGFSTDRWITGVVQRNYKGELVGAFTDKYLKPFYVNFDAPNITQLKDMLLFPSAINPDISASVVSGGLLFPGAYYAAVKYAKRDGTETAYLAISSPQIITGTTGQATDQGLEIKLANLDGDYEQVQIAIINKTNGVTTVSQFLNPTSVSGSATILYTGNELTEAITLEEVLIAPAYYDQVDTMGQLNDALYIGGLVSTPDMKLQPFANMVRLKWKSELITVDPANPDMKSGTKKTFMHDEVGAFYIRYKKTTGGFTPAYHIPGPVPASGDLDASTLASAEGLTAQRFQVEDRINSFDAASGIGYCGTWQNSDEVYPSTDDYNSAPYGGEDLRGAPVRHHKFPSIKWCKANLYAGTPDYGRGSLDRLGIIAENIIIPSAYTGQINGYEILYAKRNTSNSTVLGQSLLLFGSRADADPEYGPVNYFTSGGNFNSEINFSSTGHKKLDVDQSIFRFHAFDILLNQPILSPAYLSLELQHSRNQLTSTPDRNSEDFIDDSGAMTRPTVFLFDYLKKGTPPTVPSTVLKAVQNTEYVPNNTQVGKWQNKGGETCYAGELTHPAHLISSGNIDTNQVWKERNRRHGVNKETTFLTNMKSLLPNLYVPFTGQTLVRAGTSNDITSQEVLWGGDTYICDYTFHTYGWWVSDQAQTEDQFKLGTHCVRRFLCECASNLYGRTETPGNLYSDYYPKSALSPGDANNYDATWTRSQDPNQFGYSKDSNALDDLISTTIFDTYADQLTSHPYRIHRGGKLSKQTKNRSWRTFLPLDYYELQKNMGRITKLEGMDDRLLIHCENALLITQDKAQLNTSDILSVTLGSGNIFQFEPQEGMSSKLGYAGNQHELATTRTPFGYAFLDSALGQVFLFKGQLQLITQGMITFFSKYLGLKDKNVFQGNGYTIGYDPTYKRLLLTIKNKALAASGQNVYDYNPTILPTLPDNSYVNYNGRLVKFLGVNDPEATGFSCPSDLVPSANDLTVTIDENTAIGVQIGTVTGSNVNNFYLATTGTPFRLDTSGHLFVSGAMDYYVQNEYIMSGVAMNDNGQTATFTVTVHLTLVNTPPRVHDTEVTIHDDEATLTDVTYVAAFDREGGSLTYAITSGNEDGVFSINNSTGLIKLADVSTLNGLVHPIYRLGVSVTDSSSAVGYGTVTVNVLHINRPPVPVSDTITILDSIASGTTVYTIDTTGWDMEDDSLEVVFVGQTITGAFTYVPVDGKVILLTNTIIDPASYPTMVLNFTVSDRYHAPVPFTLTVNVIWDRESIAFIPSSPSCTGGTPTCPSGWTLSDDGTTCTRVTTASATSSGGSSTLLAHYDYSQYGEWGTIIYPYGTYNTDGSPTVKPNTSLILSGSPLWSFKPGGEMSYGGNLWGNPTGGTLHDGTCGRLNQLGVWKQGDQSYNTTPLGFSRQFTVPASGRYFINVGVDDYATINVNGTAIVTQNLANINSAFNTLYGASVATTADLYRYMHMYEVELTAGVNVIGITGTNGTSIGVVGCEIYKATAAQLEACTNTTNLAPYIIFSSAAPPYGSISDGDKSDVGLYNCDAHPGYVLVYDPGTDSYYCKLIESEASTTTHTTCQWANVTIQDVKRTTTIEIVPNEVSSPVALFQDVPIPYYPPVENSDQCSGTVHLYLSAQKGDTAQKNNCDPMYTGSIIKYTVPAGSYSSTASQATADGDAQSDVDTNKQSYANSKGICI